MTQGVHFLFKRVLDEFFVIFSRFLHTETLFLKNAPHIVVWSSYEKGGSGTKEVTF